MVDFDNMLISGALIEDTTTGRVFLGPGSEPIMYYNLTDVDVQRVKRASALMSQLMFEIGAKKVLLSFASLPSISGPEEIPKIFDDKIKKTDLELMTVHIMGTTRMGSDASRSVTDQWGELHETKNLFVSDASLFPTSIGVNPMITIMALAHRIADHILNNTSHYLMNKR